MRCALSLLLLLATSSACITEPPNPYANRSVITPREVAGRRQWIEVAAGFFHTCGLTTDGKAYCWGSNRNYQLGVETVANKCDFDACARHPVEVSGGRTFTKIAAFGDASCALESAGTVWCWGQLAVQAGALPPTTATPMTIVADSPFVALSGGGCALTESGMAYCWGDNQYGQLGDGTLTSRSDARPVTTSVRFRSISSAGWHTCAVSLDGVAYCWGRNPFGQLGLGEVPYNNLNAPIRTPTAVQTDLRFTSIGAGGIEFSCALAVDGKVYCWGRDDNASQLGDRTSRSHRGIPGPVADNHVFATISVGDVSTCALTPAGDSWCWGSNYFGALTHPAVLQGGGIDFPVPTRGSPYSSVSVGGSHACGLKADNRLFCWGDGFFGQVGS